MSNPEKSKNLMMVRDEKDKGSNKIRRIRIPSSVAMMMILDPISRVKYQANLVLVSEACL